MERSDEEILADYMSGNDEKAVQMIFLRYKTRVLNFCLRMLGNRADAEDVTADVFLAVFARRINIQHRLVYQVIPNAKTVKIIRMWTHYE